MENGAVDYDNFPFMRRMMHFLYGNTFKKESQESKRGRERTE